MQFDEARDRIGAIAIFYDHRSEQLFIILWVIERAIEISAVVPG